MVSPKTNHNVFKGPTILAFNATSGELKSMWGENMFWMPHGLTVDKYDNIWVTDVGLHQVFKVSIFINCFKSSVK